MKTFVLRSALATVSLVALACASGCTSPAADEDVASEVSAVTQWTTTVIDSYIGGAEQIVECDIDADTILFALNTDGSLWGSLVDHRSTHWYYQRHLPAGVKDLACAGSHLHVLMNDGRVFMVDNLTANSEDGMAGLDFEFNAPADATALVGTYGLKPDGSKVPAMMSMTTAGTLWHMAESSEDPQNPFYEGQTFPYVDRIAPSISLLEADGSPTKYAALFAFDKNNDLMWYTDTTLPGAWERSALSIPRDGSSPRQDLAISLQGRAPGRRMAGLYVLRNNKLYYNVP